MRGYGGWSGKVLHVDLSTGRTWTEDTVEKYRDDLGGTGIGYRVMWEEVPPGTGPFDPANRMVFAVGPLAGTGAPCNGRTAVTTLWPTCSPQSLVATGHMGGQFAAKLKYALSEPNLMVLDHARCAVDGGSAGEEKFILAIDKELRAALGASPRSGHMVQPWVAGERKPEKDLAFSLAYSFTCEKIPAKGVVLCIERPDLYTITLNGKKVKAEDKGFWMDPAIRRIPLPRLKKGENALVLEGRYHEFLPGFEAIFLMGEFGVRDERVVCALPETLDIGDWVPQGLENFGGNATYAIPIGRRPAAKGRVVLRIPAWRGAALGIRVNGGAETLLPWPPYELDVTDALRDSRNVVKVTVYGHRRNACGPFYLKDCKWPTWSGPGEMDRHDVRERGLVPCGLLKPVELAFS